MLRTSLCVAHTVERERRHLCAIDHSVAQLMSVGTPDMPFDIVAH